MYDRIVAAARQPVLYADWNVPDTPLGRYEMISLHLFLVLHRLRGETGARELAQGLTDRFFAELDHSIRELGVGDLSVPKRMKKFARMFYGRVASYGEAIDRGDAELLAAALARNVRPGETLWRESAELSRHVVKVQSALAEQSLTDILSGQVTFPLPDTTEREELR
ncbi:ubiquinol-cytochrome C chaperone family protein [Mesorhizobium sp. BAC0120]|uniref:ubiquinol-cytochrome C chaperone family protein n=1 Tax=Mesorhizobium sp. BAC0120 TaxID=3090670 RepID=UPI00399A24FB